MRIALKSTKMNRTNLQQSQVLLCCFLEFKVCSCHLDFEQVGKICVIHFQSPTIKK
jgi:hypothetical protein